MNKWYFEIGFKGTTDGIVVYEDGSVYQKGQKKKPFTLSNKQLDMIQYIIKENEYMFKKSGGYINFKENNTILRINSNTKKHPKLKIVGWAGTQVIISIVLNKQEELIKLVKTLASQD